MPKILIIKLGALGDVVMATSLIKQIQSSHAEAELHLLTTPGFSGLFNDWPQLETTTFPRKGLANTLRCLQWIRSQHFNRVYDLQSNDRSQILCGLSGIPEKVGNHPRYPYTHHPDSHYTGQCHIFERMNQVLASANITAAEPAPFLPLATEGKQHVANWLRDQHLADQSFCVMHAGASPQWPSKRWPYFLDLAKQLEQAGLHTLWLGADDDQALNQQLSAETGIDATGQFSINELAFLGSKARFAITNDSGPMHILSASKIPVFTFFGPTSWKRNHALGQQDRVLHHTIDCSPCSLGNCPKIRAHQCMASISIDHVIDKLKAESLV